MKKTIFTLGQRIADAIKELCKEENIVWKSSAYGGNRFGFKISKEWSEKYPELLKNSDDNIDVMLSQYFRVLCCTIIEKDVAKKIGLNNKHIRLLRRSYYDYESVDEFFDDIFLEDSDEDFKNEMNNCVGILFLAYKRPFGNSNVIGDVLEEFDISTVDENGDDIEKDWEEEYGYLLEETVQKIKDFFIYHPFDSSLQVEYYMYRFSLSNGYLRKHKIRKILNSKN